MQEPIISVSGLRGVVGESLSPQLAMRYACAFAAELGEGPIVLTRDGRATGKMLADALRAGLCAIGRHVLDHGIAATPTTGVLVRQHQAAGGVQISASHNPAPYNGLKLFGPEGSVLTADAGQPVVQRYRSGEPEWVPHERVGGVREVAGDFQRHRDLVAATVDVDRIRGQEFRVVLDANHGAGSLLGRALLEHLGCRLTLLGGVPNGRFVHPPEPTAENLADVCAQITAAGAAVGFCQDPDADRLAIIDQEGRYLGEEYTLAICLDHVLAQRPGPIVTNCATSRMAQDLAARYEVPYHASSVGEANVVARMQAVEAVFGGEGNGGPIDPRVGYVRDSFVGMALVLDAMAAAAAPVSELADRLPRYAIHKTKTPLDRAALAAGQERLLAHFADAQASRLDGLRLDWPDRWLLIRASNTEPIARIIAEAPTRDDARSLCREAAEQLGAT